LTAVAPGWPVELRDGGLLVRPLRLRDGPVWVESRKHNIDWLREWEATPPGGDPLVPSSAATFVVMTRRLRQEARHGRGLPFVIEVDGAFAGQINVSGLTRGSLHSASLGYWKTLDDDYHWHIEILPILSAKAKSYTFKEVYYSPVSPESAAKRLREAQVET